MVYIVVYLQKETGHVAHLAFFLMGYQSPPLHTATVWLHCELKLI